MELKRSCGMWRGRGVLTSPRHTSQVERMIPGFLRRSGAPLFLLMLMGAAHPLAGQSPEDRAALEKFRDSLRAVEDTSALVKLEASLITVAKADRDNAMNHLRLGFEPPALGYCKGNAAFR